jgi:hypothetical protein
VTRAEGGDFQQLEASGWRSSARCSQHLEAEERHLIPALAKDRPARRSRCSTSTRASQQAARARRRSRPALPARRARRGVRRGAARPRSPGREHLLPVGRPAARRLTSRCSFCGRAFSGGAGFARFPGHPVRKPAKAALAPSLKRGPAVLPAFIIVALLAGLAIVVLLFIGTDTLAQHRWGRVACWSGSSRSRCWCRRAASRRASTSPAAPASACHATRCSATGMSLFADNRARCRRRTTRTASSSGTRPATRATPTTRCSAT